MTKDTDAKVAAVLKRIESGESENAACIAEKMNRGTFRSACLRVAAADNYARACEALARDQVEKLEVCIQEMRDGTLTPEQARIEIEARKWTASRLFRPTWGDKLSQEVSGPGGGPQNHEFSWRS